MRTVKRVRSMVLISVIGLPVAGCAAQADRAAVAPTYAVYIPVDLAATCEAGPRDRFEFDADATPRDPSECHRMPTGEMTALDIPEGAPPEKRARAVTRFLEAGVNAPSAAP